MSDPFFDPPRGAIPIGDDLDQAKVFVDPAHLEESERWEARAAQWRARALVEAVFEGDVVARLAEQGVRGLLHLDVPFHDLADHRARKRVFLVAVDRDPLMTRVPLVFVLGPSLVGWFR